MKCASCGTDNPAGMRFCGGCAAPLSGACADQIGPAQAAADARAPQSADAAATEFLVPRDVARGELKLVTVLFADVSGFTGLVYAGDVGGGGRRDYSVMGDAVSIASRLKGLAQPGEIVVGVDTYRQAGHLFDWQPAGTVWVKGKAEPITTYRLVGLRATPGGGRGLEAALGCAPAWWAATRKCGSSSGPSTACRRGREASSHGEGL